MKTIKELLEELPEPYRSKALANQKRMLTGEKEVENVAKALKGGFIWSETPEGREYWSDYHFKLFKQFS